MTMDELELRGLGAQELQRLEAMDRAGLAPWEYYTAVLGRRCGDPGRLRSGSTGEIAHLLSEAAVELIEWLTARHGWPWSAARLLAGRFIDRSADWVMSGDTREALDANLQGAWRFGGPGGARPRHPVGV